MNKTRKSTIRQVVRKKSDKLEFGKYKGISVSSILEKEASYILWLDEKEIVDFSEDIVETAEVKSKKQHANWLRDNYEDTGELDNWGDRD